MDEVVEVAARPLCRHHQGAVLLETPGVAQVGDVLAGRPPAAGVTTSRGVGATGVEGVGHPCPQLSQLGPHRGGGGDLGGLLLRCADRPLLHLEQHGVRRHRIAGSDRHSTDGTRAHRDHLVFHLHRLNDQKRLTDVDPITRSNGHTEDGAGERRDDGRGGHLYARVRTKDSIRLTVAVRTTVRCTFVTSRRATAVRAP